MSRLTQTIVTELPSAEDTDYPKSADYWRNLALTRDKRAHKAMDGLASDAQESATSPATAHTTKLRLRDTPTHSTLAPFLRAWQMQNLGTMKLPNAISSTSTLPSGDARGASTSSTWRYPTQTTGTGGTGSTAAGRATIKLPGLVDGSTPPLPGVTRQQVSTQANAAASWWSERRAAAIAAQTAAGSRGIGSTTTAQHSKANANARPRITAETWRLVKPFRPRNSTQGGVKDRQVDTNLRV